MILTAVGPPLIAALTFSPVEVIGTAFILSLFASLIIPVWAGVRRAELIKKRRVLRQFRRLERNVANLDAPVLNFAELWDAAAYQRHGGMPWTIFAYPRSQADERRLPRDEASVRFLAALHTVGLQVGVWDEPQLPHVYYACPGEERELVDNAIRGLEQKGFIPKDIASDRTEYLISAG
jgi:hypothetical protein